MKYSDWEIIKDLGTKGSSYHRYVLAQCKCGKIQEKRLDLLKNGSSKKCKSCASAGNKSHVIHNMYLSAEYRIWTAIKRRCLNPKSDNYKFYGGRGITICKRWENSFSNFLKDMGKKPSPQHSVDRINNDGNYEPSNCRWATAKQQANNRGRSK